MLGRNKTPDLPLYNREGDLVPLDEWIELMGRGHEYQVIQRSDGLLTIWTGLGTGLGADGRPQILLTLDERTDEVLANYTTLDSARLGHEQIARDRREG